jgi:hypothetical protein
MLFWLNWDFVHQATPIKMKQMVSCDCCVYIFFLALQYCSAYDSRIIEHTQSKSLIINIFVRILLFHFGGTELMQIFRCR